MLDARVVAANMYQRNALTLRELQSIQSLRDRPVEAAETLLNIIMEQPDAVYLCFLDVLKCGEQYHIYQRLVHDGYKGLYERFDEIPHRNPRTQGRGLPSLVRSWVAHVPPLIGTDSQFYSDPLPV